MTTPERTPQKVARESPGARANFLSTVFFSWLDPLIKKGYNNELQLTDLYAVTEDNSSGYLGKRLEREWKTEVETDRSSKTRPSYRRALLRCFRWQLVALAVFTLMEEAARTAQPLLLARMLDYFKPSDEFGTTDNSSHTTAVQAYMYALGLTLTAAVTVLMHHPRYFYSSVMGMQMRLSSCQLIFAKVLKLASADTGHVMNLVSADVARLDYGFMFIHYLWVAPVQAVVVLAVIWLHLGQASLPGYVLVLLMAPLQRIQGLFQARLRRKTAKESDERIRLMDQVITGMKVIKMYCWETPFAELVAAARRREMRIVAKASRLKLVLMELGFFTFSKLATAACILAYVLIHGRMPPLATILIVMRLLSTVQEGVAFSLTHAVTSWGEVSTTCKRIQEFLMGDEIDVGPPPLPCHPEDVLMELESFSGSWDKAPSGSLMLHDVTLRASAKELLAIVGPVGCGKTSVLMALLGELRLTSGQRIVRGRLAYAAQQPWIFSASLRENILFGLPFNPVKYDAVVESCALDRDLASLEHGDETLVGERGVKLSGGQKARVALARAVYSDADVYLLDDPLSAVDASVAEHLFHKCINGILKDRCRVLVTHQLHLLEHVAKLAVIDNGRVAAAGTFTELARSGVDFAKLLNHSPAQAAASPEPTAAECTAEREVKLQSPESGPAGAGNETANGLVDGAFGAGIHAEPVAARAAGAPGPAGDSADQEVQTGDFPEKDPLLIVPPNPPVTVATSATPARQHVNPEGVQHGAVSGKTYWLYFRSGANVCGLIALTLLLVLGQASFMTTDWYISHWAANEDTYYHSLRSNVSALSLGGETQPSVFSTLSGTAIPAAVVVTGTSTFGILNSTAVPAGVKVTDVDAYDTSTATTLGDYVSANGTALPLVHVWQYLPAGLENRMYIYAGLIGGLMTISCLRTLLFYQVCFRACEKMHNLMFTAVVYTPMRFFETNPTGRIMNRFSKDVDVVDAQLPPKFFEFFTFFLLIVGSVTLAAYSNPWVLLPLVPVVVALLFVRRYYIRSARALKRLEGIARSPMMSHLSSTLAGLHTVRAYGAQSSMAVDFDKHQDGHTEPFYLSLCVTRWLGIRLDWMCVFFVASVAFLCITAKDSLGLGADLFGLAITYVIALMGLFQWVVRLSIEIESQMTSVERLAEYVRLPSESVEPLPKSAGRPLLPAGWPQAGSLLAENLSLRYAADEPIVLRNINFHIHGSEKIGICGRTGAGKSSLLSALFRLSEPGGRLLIDGVCISDIDLHDLRSKLSIIPQDPVLFHSSVRRNLDPFGRHSDDELWNALQQVQLAACVRELPSGLDAAIAEGGTNFSVGQRQLMCLARAVIHRNRILVVDEATANVDRMTDAAIQETIKDKFRDCTVLTIAHRLDTIMDSDRVMVLEAGSICEFDSPYTLLQQSDSMFHSLALHTGIDYSHLVAIARATHDKHAKATNGCQSQSTGGTDCNNMS